MCLKLCSYVVLIYSYSFSFPYSSTMHHFRDEIVLEVETFDNVHQSDSDKDCYFGMEKDISDNDSEERDALRDDDPLIRHENLAEEAPPYPSEKEIIPMEVPTNTISNIQMVSKKRKGRGPMKSLKVTESMHLEYNTLGQPYSKCRKQYRKQIGIYIYVRFLYFTHETRFHGFEELSTG